LLFGHKFSDKKFINKINCLAIAAPECDVQEVPILRAFGGRDFARALMVFFSNLEVIKAEPLRGFDADGEFESARASSAFSPIR
jgi:hypothetical protein